ncbi:MAG: tetratricopeptide repeat protein [Nitrospirae bacterium]|nr:MAG: tetratricopeptide repeat protein [Nitrospirota bacterium]
MADMNFLQKPFRPAGFWFHLFLIILISFCVYANSLGVPFQFDDIPNIVENVGLRGDGIFTRPWSYLGGVKAVNLQGVGGEAIKSRYLGYLSFALNYRIHGLDVSGYHIVNIAVHAANGVLVYLFVRLIYGTPVIRGQRATDDMGAAMTALFSGIIFAVHPVQTQAVTYIVQRFASLAVMFCLLSIVFYGAWRTRQEEGRGGDIKGMLFYWGSVIFSVCAMKTKEMVFTFPLLVCLYEYMFYRGAASKRLKWLVPILLTMLIIPLGLIDTAKPLGEIIGDTSQVTRVQSALSRADYLFTEFRVMATYLRLLFVPVGQNLDYDYPVHKSFLNAEVILSFLMLAGLMAFALYLWKASGEEGREGLRIVSFGILWYVIAHLVESGMIPIVDVIYEHRLYYPSVGFVIGFVSLVFYISSPPLRGGDEGAGEWGPFRKAVMVFMVLLVATLGIASHMRNRVWQSDLSLWQDVVSKSPNKVRGHDFLGTAYYRREIYDRALISFDSALKLNPDFYISYNNRGLLFARTGGLTNAVSDFESALKLNPAFVPAYYNRAFVYSQLGNNNMAIADYTNAISLRPDFADAYNNRGNVYLLSGQYDKAVSDYTAAIDLIRVTGGEFAEGHYNRGLSFYKAKRFDMAAPDFDKACGLGIADACMKSSEISIRRRP